MSPIVVNNIRKLIYCIWILSYMIETDRISLR
ncbi:unnamed protein product, partial [Rotaria sordida]